jgi:hypothetical protein
MPTRRGALRVFGASAVNERYVAGETRRHDFKHEREALAGGQNPYAGILSCADSRIAPEYALPQAKDSERPGSEVWD